VPRRGCSAPQGWPVTGYLKPTQPANRNPRVISLALSGLALIVSAVTCRAANLRVNDALYVRLSDRMSIYPDDEGAKDQDDVLVIHTVFANTGNRAAIVEDVRYAFGPKRVKFARTATGR
jgi:hypothetical protein